jgi:hypothetical protein
MQLRTSILASCVLAWLAMAGSAPAAFIYDLRFSDGTKTKTVALNTSYTVQLWGQISNTPGNPFENDGIVYTYFSVDPVKQGNGAFYNPLDLGGTSGVGITSINLTVKPRNGTNINGLQRTGYTDNIRGWGGDSGSTAQVTGWAKTDFGTYTDQVNQSIKQGWVMGSPYWEEDPDNPGTPLYPPIPGQPVTNKSRQVNATTWEVLLGQFTVRSGANINATGNPASDKTLFQLRVQPTLKSGVTDLEVLGYYQDNPNIPSGAAAQPLNLTTGNVQGQTTFVTFEAIPEPTTVALLAAWAFSMAGIFWLRRE